jgi:hypothetical protein
LDVDSAAARISGIACCCKYVLLACHVVKRGHDVWVLAAEHKPHLVLDSSRHAAVVLDDLHCHIAVTQTSLVHAAYTRSQRSRAACSRATLGGQLTGHTGGISGVTALWACCAACDIRAAAR